MALNQRSEFDGAGSEWQEAARLRPDMVEAHRALAEFAVRKGDMPGLDQAASQVISLQPGSPDGYALRSFSFMARKQFPAAEQDARKATELAPQAAVGYLEMGNLRALEQKFSEAETWYKQSLNRDPNSADALRGLLTVDLAQKQTDKAIAAANAQIALSPSNSMFYDLLGDVLLNKKDYSGAQTALKKAVDLDKKNADAYMKLGQAQSASGAMDEAMATYNRALRVNPKEAAFYLLMAGLYENKHDLEKAR